MNLRSLLPALALITLGLSQAACSTLSRPEEITIQAEPAAAPVKAAAQVAQPQPLPMPNRPAAAPPSGACGQ